MLLVAEFFAFILRFDTVRKGEESVSSYFIFTRHFLHQPLSDLKIKTSDEGRVMKTAAAFAKGLLELEGDLPPILVSLVHKEKGSMHMLDPSGNKEVKSELDICKERITANLQQDVDIEEASEEILEAMAGPKELQSVRDALHTMKNPRTTLVAIHQTMGELITQLEEMLDEIGSGDERRIEGGEGLEGRSAEDVALRYNFQRVIVFIPT